MFGQSCGVSITERAPARRSASARKVLRPTEIERLLPHHEKYAWPARSPASRVGADPAQPPRADSPTQRALPCVARAEQSPSRSVDVSTCSTVRGSVAYTANAQLLERTAPSPAG